MLALVLVLVGWVAQLEQLEQLEQLKWLVAPVELALGRLVVLVELVLLVMCLVLLEQLEQLVRLEWPKQLERFVFVTQLGIAGVPFGRLGELVLLCCTGLPHLDLVVVVDLGC